MVVRCGILASWAKSYPQPLSEWTIGVLHWQVFLYAKFKRYFQTGLNKSSHKETH